MSKYGLNAMGMPNFEKKDFKWLKQNYPEFVEWLDGMCAIYSVESLCEIKDYGDGAEVNLYSQKNIYHIYMSHPKTCEKNKGYLGLTHSNRVTRAGNDWTDGPYNRIVFDEIIKYIFSLEIEMFQNQNIKED